MSSSSCADNRGEGADHGADALALHNAKGNARREKMIMLAGLLGAGMFYGMAWSRRRCRCSRRSRGSRWRRPCCTPFIIPVTLLVLFVLFFAQRKGTATVGAFFGPVMMLWFGTLAVLGWPMCSPIPVFSRP